MKARLIASTNHKSGNTVSTLRIFTALYQRRLSVQYLNDGSLPYSNIGKANMLCCPVALVASTLQPHLLIAGVLPSPNRVTHDPNCFGYLVPLCFLKEVLRGHEFDDLECIVIALVSISNRFTQWFRRGDGL